ARCGPARLTLVEQSELNLFQIERAMAEIAPSVDVEVAMADVTRGALFNRVVRAAQPDVIYHAAPYKHVTVVERAVSAAARANGPGSVVAADAARRAGARFVLISTDKAAAPKSVMGATKRMAERLVLARATDAFRPIVVRFGNVLGSSGSVLT